MDYNSNREKIVMPEYGRNIKKIIDSVVKIEDRDERNRAASQTIKIMGDMFPYLRDVPDFKHKLWDHIAIISEFKLDIDSPYPAPELSELRSKPKRVPYTTGRVRYKHYGKLIDKFISKVKDCKNEEEQDKLISLIANQMKKSYVVWNKESVSDQEILLELKNLLPEGVEIKESLILRDTRDIVSRARKPRTQDSRNRPPQNRNQHNRGGKPSSRPSSNIQRSKD